MDLIVAPTEYAKRMGVRCSTITEADYDGEGDNPDDWEGFKGCNYSIDCIGREGAIWWLRSSGGFQYRGSTIDSSGYGGYAYNVDVNSEDIGVRPALLISQ